MSDHESDGLCIFSVYFFWFGALQLFRFCMTDTDIVFQRLVGRPGVISVTLATKKEGFVVQSTLGADSDEAKKLAKQFSGVVKASSEALRELEQKSEVMTVRTEKLEYVITSPTTSESVEESDNLFLLVIRDPTKVV